MSILKSFVSRFPGGESLARRFSNFRRGRKLAKIGNTEDRFTHIFEQNRWKDPESISGSGSSFEYTENIRKEIPRLLECFGVTRILDAPCGDYNWFQTLKRNNVSYIGGDIVKALVESNNDSYGDETTSFVHLDITKDVFPDADLWMCRDCLIHLSFDLINEALANLKRSNIRYLLVSSYREIAANHDIPTGHARMLNMRLAPFEFPEPLTTIDDPAQGLGKELALWDREQLFPPT